MTAVVYIARDGEGEVLYVGHSRDLPSRMRNHKKSSPWWQDVADLEVAEFPTVTEAQADERRLIADLEPLHNRLGNPRFHPYCYEVPGGTCVCPTEPCAGLDP